MVLVVGIFLGTWLWGKYGVKSSTRVDVVEGNDIRQAAAKVSPISEFDKTGKETKEVEISGLVQVRILNCLIASVGVILFSELVYLSELL